MYVVPEFVIVKLFVVVIGTDGDDMGSCITKSIVGSFIFAVCVICGSCILASCIIVGSCIFEIVTTSSIGSFKNS